MAEQAVLGYGEALAYGLIQGLTEFLPVSSSGHLALAHLLGLGAIPDHLQLAFDVLLHLATLFAIMVAFRADLLAALRAGPRYWAVCLIAVVPAGMAGLLGKGVVEQVNESWLVIGLCYLYTAGLLVSAERRSMAQDDTAQITEQTAIGWRAALCVGLFQVLALLPGVSRSGSTIAAGLLAGLRPVLAVSFAFVVGLPLIAAAAAKDAIDPDAGFRALHQHIGSGPLTVAFLSSLLSGLGAIVLLRWVVGQRRLGWFAVYCLLIGMVCLVTGILH